MSVAEHHILGRKIIFYENKVIRLGVLKQSNDFSSSTSGGKINEISHCVELLTLDSTVRKSTSTVLNDEEKKPYNEVYTRAFWEMFFPQLFTDTISAPNRSILDVTNPPSSFNASSILKTS